MIQKAAAYYLIGILTFASLKIWSIDFQTYAYYLWECGKDVIVWTAIYTIASKKSKPYCLAVLVVAIFSFIIDLICTIRKTSQNSFYAVESLFFVTLVSVGYLWYKSFKNKDS